jgi:thiamine-monophosphate kinase
MTKKRGEFALIDKISKIIGKSSSKVILGIGDDAAILLPPAGRILATTDMLVENVHFDLKYTTAEELGHKALAVNLSDIAAMAGRPQFVLVSLGIPLYISDKFILDMYRGMKRLAQRFNVEIVGGNITRHQSLTVDISCLGAGGKPILRRGARIGDWIGVTGSLGSSAAGFAALKKWGNRARRSYGALVRAHLQPEPRINEALAFSRTRRLSSLIDISDGLAAELYHLAKSSRVGFLIEKKRIPVRPLVRKLAQKLGVDAEYWALHGGEDYELLMSGSGPPPKNVTTVGKVMPMKQGVCITDGSSPSRILSDEGWDHLKR